MKFEFVSIEPDIALQKSNVNNAGIVPVLKEKTVSVPKFEAKQTLQSKSGELVPKESEILTKIRPYKEKDLLRQVEDEMEGMMDEMKKNY